MTIDDRYVCPDLVLGPGELVAPSTPESQLQSITNGVRLYALGVAELAQSISDHHRESDACWTQPLSPSWAPTSSVDPFGDLIEGVSSGPDLNLHHAGLPTSRFMVRVATVPQPHRATKRNYNYFEALDATLAAKGLDVTLPHSG